MIKIWGRPTSGCTQRSLWCMEEAGLSFELTLASGIMGPKGHISKGGPPYGIVDTPEYRAMNPNGTLPTINDNGFILWESNAIIAYIAMKHCPELYCRDIGIFARAIAWGSWCNEHLDPSMAALVNHLVRFADHLRRADIIEKARQEMPKQLQTLEAHLSRQPYLVGEHFTIADISVGPSVHRWLLFDLERPQMPHLEEWHARLASRPAFQKHIAPREFHLEG